MLLFQIPRYRLVREQFREIPLRQHQIEHVLTVGLLDQLVLPLQVAHFALHLGHLLLRHAGTVDGQRHEVIVHVDDFEYAGQRYKSLSRIAMIITGTNRNGWTFFGLSAGRTL